MEDGLIVVSEDRTVFNKIVEKVSNLMNSEKALNTGEKIVNTSGKVLFGVIKFMTLVYHFSIISSSKSIFEKFGSLIVLYLSAGVAKSILKKVTNELKGNIEYKKYKNNYFVGKDGEVEKIDDDVIFRDHDISDYKKSVL